MTSFVLVFVRLKVLSLDEVQSESEAVPQNSSVYRRKEAITRAITTETD